MSIYVTLVVDHFLALPSETTVRSLPSQNSFLQWDVLASYNASNANSAATQLQLLFRTRRTDAVIFMASSFSTLERVILELSALSNFFLFLITVYDRLAP